MNVATPFHVVFDVASCLLNLFNVQGRYFILQADHEVDPVPALLKNEACVVFQCADSLLPAR